MNILITGNLGYVGPGVVKQLRNAYPDAKLIGFDTGYFVNCLINGECPSGQLLNFQHIGDIRTITKDILENIDAVVNLAAISNDPMGNVYEQLTMEINYHACIALAEMAKKAGVKCFVFASSCSVYGASAEDMRSELSPVNPLTAYAKSKSLSEQGLQALADENFMVTCLRFPTACGMSSRLRLDLVLNDFVAAALTAKKITILSDGTPWRPLIDVRDMALAIDWALSRKGEDYLVINAGAENCNYTVKELADVVANKIGDVEVSINKNASPDKRSYKVDFSLFNRLIEKKYQLKHDLHDSIDELVNGLRAVNFKDPNFRDSNLIRLNWLRQLSLA